MQTATTDQTGQMPRLICVFLLRISHFVGFVMRLLIYWMKILAVMCFSSFYHKIMFSAVKNTKAILISYFHSYVYIKHRFGMYYKSFAAYIHVHVMLLLFW